MPFLMEDTERRRSCVLDMPDVTYHVEPEGIIARGPGDVAWERIQYLVQKTINEVVERQYDINLDLGVVWKAFEFGSGYGVRVYDVGKTDDGQLVIEIAVGRDALEFVLAAGYLG